MPEKPEAHTPRFFAWLYSTPSQQPVLAALCAIEREIGASLRSGIDHPVAHSRLEWWREECARCAAGQPVHPLTRALRAHWERLAPEAQARPALAALSGLVDLARWDLAGATFARREELTGYCRRWAAAMIEPLRSKIPEVDATRLGAALREIELLGHLAPEARGGRLRLPLAELEQAGVAPEAIATPPWPAALSEILRQRHEALRGELSAAVAGLTPESQQRLRGLLVWSALSAHLSRRAERALPQPDPAGGAPARSIASAAAMNWRAWRAARAAAAGVFRLDPKSPGGASGGRP